MIGCVRLFAFDPSAQYDTLPVENHQIGISTGTKRSFLVLYTETSRKGKQVVRKRTTK